MLNTDLSCPAFSLTHNPRPEDFPIMPVERVTVALRPDGFFEKNPALDVPPSDQSLNKSTQHPDSGSGGCASCPGGPKL